MICEECIHYSVCKYFGGTFKGENFVCKFADKRANYRLKKTGKWEYWAGTLVRCSNCGHEYIDRIECDKFCGNCGAEIESIG